MSDLWREVEEENRLLAEAARRRARFASAQQSFGGDMADRAIAMAQAWPNASPGLVQAAAQDGLTPERFAGVAALDDGGYDVESGFDRAVGAVLGAAASGWDAVWNYTLKPLIRGTFTAADTLAQEVVQRPLTSALVAAQDSDVGFGEAYDRYGDSAGLNVIQGDYDRSDPDGVLGRGLFAGGAAQARSERERTLTVDGMQANFGRALTSAVTGEFLDPGSTAYNTVAGVTQFAGDVLLDPAALLTGGSATAARAAGRLGASARTVDAVEGGLQGARRAARTLDGNEAADLLRAADDAATVALPVPADRSELAVLLREQAGALATAERRTVLAEKAEQFFRNPQLLGKLAEADAYTIYQSFKRSTGTRIDRQLIGRLGAATDEGEIAEILLTSVADGLVTERGFYSGPRGFRRKVREAKFAGIAPTGTVSPDDLDTAADKLDSLLRQANVERDVRAGYFSRMAGLADGDAEGLLNTVADALGDVAARLPDGTVSGELTAEAKRLTRIFGQDVEAFRRYGTDALGDPIQTPFTKRRMVQNFDGEDVELLVPTPQISSELADLAFQLPDAQEIRRAATQTALLRRVYTARGWDVTESALRTITDKAFKPLAILRPAYVPRIGMEEQARLSAANLDSLFSHPWRFIQANMVDRKAAADLLGDDLLKRAEALNVIGSKSVGILDNPTTSTSHLWDALPKSDSEAFVSAWRRELGQLASAPEVRQLAAVRGNLDEFLDWARNTPEGRTTIERMSGVNAQAKALLTDDDAMRRWATTVVRRLDVKTGRDGDLLDGIANGTILGTDDALSDANVNRLLRSKLDHAPATVKYEKADVDGRIKDYRDRAVEALYTAITRKPTEYLARFPAMRQLMARNVADLMPNLATDALRREAFEAAAKNLKLTKPEHARIAQAAQDAAGKAGMVDTLDGLNELVVIRAADETKGLLFDVSRRSAAQDAFDVALPFLDAFMEVSKTWAGLVTENPAWFLRAQAGYRSLEQGGVFHVNGFGDTVFSFPGGGALTSFFARMNQSGGGLGSVPGAAVGAIGDALTGKTPANESLTLEGRVEGLNLVVQGVGPGFGPVVQWAAGAFVPDTPSFDRLRDFIAPFGSTVDDPGDLADPASYTDALIPAWARKVTNAWTRGKIDPIQWNSTVGDALKVLAESGRYDPANPADQRRLIEDAERTGAWVLFVRGIAQATAPTGPSATWNLSADVNQSAIPSGWDPETDPSGKWHAIGTMASDYYRLVQQFGGDYQLATASFIDMYGREPYFITQGKTRSLRELPVTEAGDTWIRQHEGFAERNPLVAGYFVPPDEMGELDYGVFRRQLEAGDRQSLTAEQQLGLANQTKARSIKYAVADRVAGLPSAARTRVMSQVNVLLEEQFPGYNNPVMGVGQTADTQAKIDALGRAVVDPDADASPVFRPLNVYLDARRQAIEMAQTQAGDPRATLARQDAAGIRAALADLGRELAAQHPAFQGLWTQLLAREVEA